jgi:hypothetical protein
MSKVYWLKDFRPLTGTEIEERKPLFIKCGKWVLKYNLFSALNTVQFFEAKDAILNDFKTIKDGEKTTSVIPVVKMIADLLWTLRDNKKWYDYFRYKNWIKYCLYNTGVIIEAFYNLLNYQTRIFFLLQTTANLPMFQQTAYSRIGSPLSLMAEMREKKRSLLYSKFEKLKNKKQCTKRD